MSTSTSFDIINGIPYFTIFVKSMIVFGLFCCIMLIITFAAFGEGGKVRTYPIKLIMFLSASLISAYFFFLIFDLPAIVENPGACFFVGLMIHYSFLCNFLWSFCIAFNFYRMIVAQDRNTRSYEVWYHVCSWGIPGVIMIIIASLQLYGRVGDRYVCYIKDSIATLVGLTVPAVIMVTASITLFCFIAAEINETFKGAADIRGSDSADVARQAKVYLSIIVSIGVPWVFAFIALLFRAVPVAYDVFDKIFNILISSQGIFLFLSYCVNERIFKLWIHWMGKCIPSFLMVEKKLDAIASTATTQETSGSKSSSKRNKSSSKSQSQASSQSSDLSSEIQL